MSDNPDDQAPLQEFDQEFDQEEDVKKDVKDDFKGQTIPDELKIIPIAGNMQWILQRKDFEFLLTVVVMAGRLKISLRDNDVDKVPLNTYSCSWTYGELIEKNSYFKCFEDITYIEDLIKFILGNPNNVFIIGQSDDVSITIQLTLPTRYNPELELTLSLIEKNEEERIEEEQKAAKIIKKRMEDLEQGIFNLSVELKEVTDRNNIEWNVEDFPEDILKRVRENWIKGNPEKQPPWLSQETRNEGDTGNTKDNVEPA